jgi:hypothetical protein
MEKIIAHLALLSRGLIDGVTALYRPWSVVGFLEMADAPEKVASARSGRCDRQRKRYRMQAKYREKPEGRPVGTNHCKFLSAQLVPLDI